ncbi:SOS response-associated peptidase family protein [Phaeobacter porticola]|uniref:SOS response-associated peptidase family protein n=1 Tax=Phaeobacter porticola TaxID=1844006 RepID=UPI0009F935C7|nr:SOS response-associated peptidase family protein [Phaeobacter porticola]
MADQIWRGDSCTRWSAVFLGPPIPVRDPNAIELSASWNVKPTQVVDIAYLNGDQLFSTTARWWFVPSWHRGGVKGWKRTALNAKIETAASLPNFRNAWKSQQRIIPAAGYYEWTGPKGSKKLDLSRFDGGPGARLSHLLFECDRAFPAQC